MEPVAALVALTVVGIALSLYAGALVDASPDRERDRAALLFEAVNDDVVSGGVAHPTRLTVPDESPAEADVGVALVTRNDSWTAGTVDTSRPFPETADVATGAVSIRVGMGETRAGELRVVVPS
ncbi:MAG: hypothetical protein ABEH81_11150 [Halopenitus sp.]